MPVKYSAVTARLVRHPEKLAGRTPSALHATGPEWAGLRDQPLFTVKEDGAAGKSLDGRHASDHDKLVNLERLGGRNVVAWASACSRMARLTRFAARVSLRVKSGGWSPPGSASNHWLHLLKSCGGTDGKGSGRHGGRWRRAVGSQRPGAEFLRASKMGPLEKKTGLGSTDDGISLDTESTAIVVT